MAFEVRRIQEAFWPDVLGYVTYVGAELVGAAIDTARARDAEQAGEKVPFPIAQTAVTGLAGFGGLAGVGFGKFAKFSRGMVWGAGGNVVTRGLVYLYEQMTEKEAEAASIFALVPPKAAKALRKSTNRGAITTGEGRLMLSEGRAEAGVTQGAAREVAGARGSL